MNIIEAIKSGRKYRRKNHDKWRSLGSKSDDFFYLNVDELLADDWEVESEPVTITREQFDQAYVRAVVKLPSNSTTKVLIDMIAEELGL